MRQQINLTDNLSRLLFEIKLPQNKELLVILSGYNFSGENEAAIKKSFISQGIKLSQLITNIDSIILQGIRAHQLVFSELFRGKKVTE
ncbi:MAG: hypothetical protein LBF68_07680 [Christensenellaceae bacterium]|jgi:hypothetical protein|nr:hypothetical protein [Christensenellaceae bacterium]